MSVPSYVRIERGPYGGGMTLNLLRCLFFARKPVNINVLRPAVQKIDSVPASCYYCDIN